MNIADSSGSFIGWAPAPRELCALPYRWYVSRSFESVRGLHRSSFEARSTGNVMTARIYVGGLSDFVTDRQLHDLCALHGTVKSALVIIDQWTGKSRGYGFVEMGSAEESQKVVAALNATLLEGHGLRCFLI